MKQWEYKSLNLRWPNEEILNALGHVGWELVAAVNRADNSVYYFFKREITHE